MVYYYMSYYITTVCLRLKSELYKKEQEEVIDKIITILDLEYKNTYTLYKLDKK